MTTRRVMSTSCWFARHAISEDDPEWSESIARWEAHVRRISGNTVNRIEVAEDEVAKLMRSRRPLWQAVRREGVTLQGRPLTGIGARPLPKERARGGSRARSAHVSRQGRRVPRGGAARAWRPVIRLRRRASRSTPASARATRSAVRERVSAPPAVITVRLLRCSIKPGATAKTLRGRPDPVDAAQEPRRVRARGRAEGDRETCRRSG